MSATLEQLLRDARIDLVLSRIEKDESIINEVIRNLDSQIRSIKFNAILVLGELGKKSLNAVAKLNSCLEDNDWSICREATRTLGKIGDLATSSIPQISKLLDDKEESIRKEAAIAIGQIGNPTPESISHLIAKLQDKSEIVRTEVAKTLGELGEVAFESIPYLMNSLKDISWTVRTASAHSISQIGRGSIKAIPNLIIALEDPDWRVRSRVSNTLVEIGKEAVPHLHEILNNKNEIVRKEAVDTLGEMEISDPKIIESISHLLKDRKERVRGKSADALRSIGKEAIPALIKELDSASKKMKKVIISALGGIGKEAKDALPVLFNLLSIEEQEHKYVPTLGNKIKRALKSFIKDPLSKNASVRVEVARALGQIGVDSEEAINVLEKALNDPIKAVRRETALSLGKIGSLSRKAIPSLIKTLEDKNPDVRWRASEALGLIGVNTEEVIMGLNDLIHDACDYVCESAINAIDKLTEDRS